MENIQWESSQTQEFPRAREIAKETSIYENPMQITYFLNFKKEVAKNELN